MQTTRLSQKIKLRIENFLQKGKLFFFKKKEKEQISGQIWRNKSSAKVDPPYARRKNIWHIMGNQENYLFFVESPSRHPRELKVFQGNPNIFLYQQKTAYLWNCIMMQEKTPIEPKNIVSGTLQYIKRRIEAHWLGNFRYLPFQMFSEYAKTFMFVFRKLFRICDRKKTARKQNRIIIFVTCLP